MSPSNEITSLLRDEAYLMLCRRSPENAVHNGVTVHPKGSLKSRLAKIDALEDWLKSTLRTKLREYLQDASRDYSYSTEVFSAIRTWEQEVNPYGDCLLAFAQELKNAVRILAGATGNLYVSFDPRGEAMAGLHRASEGLDRASLQLDAAAKHLSQVAAGTIYAKATVLAPPFAGSVQWMARLGLRSNVEALVEMQAKDAEVRPLLASKLLPLRSSATTAREAVGEAQREYLESYWDELRRYALTNYVKDCEVDQVLDELTERYVAADQPIMQDEPALLYA